VRPFAALCVLALLRPGPARADAGAPAPDRVFAHAYREGEALEYFFEDTDYRYAARRESGLLRPKALESITDLRLRLRINVVAVSSGTARRRLEFRGGRYRSAAPEKINETPFVPLSSAIPSFPPDFGYEYDSDGKIVNQTAAFFAPFLSSEAGAFVYYKTMDIHTFQSIIDNITSDRKPGDVVLKPGRDIPLAMGTFKNAASVSSFDRIETVGGVRCGVFKVATPGNTFQDEKSGDSLGTDYQLTLYVALEGEYRGLLLRGDLQEAIVRKPDAYILRQLSMTLQTKNWHEN
jgi:hypothetical protein